VDVRINLLGHLDVEQGQVRALPFQGAQGLLPVAGFLDPTAVQGQGSGTQAPHGRFVVHDQDMLAVRRSSLNF
jgi:hypothetical protein